MAGFSTEGVMPMIPGVSGGNDMGFGGGSGYTGKELKELLLNIKFTDFYEKNKLSLLPFIGPTISLFKNKGLFSGNNIEEYLNKLYKAKGKHKFKDIAVNGKSPLKVIASDVTNKKLLVLPDDLKNYNIDPLELVGIKRKKVINLTR